VSKIHTHWAFVAFGLVLVLLISVLASAYPYNPADLVQNCLSTPGLHELIQRCPQELFQTKGSNEKIAFIEPVFTTTAYSSFYAFYAKYRKVPPGENVTKDLNLLNTTIQMGWGHSTSLYLLLKSNLAAKGGLLLGKNAFILTDIDVDRGKLFSPTNGSRLFDAAVIGFSEYVTKAEYLAFERFVATGGLLVILSATTFLAQVAYYPDASKVALIGGNTWYFNGYSAWKGPLGMWNRDNTNWVGSNYGLFYASEKYSISGAIANTSNPYGWELYSLFGSRLFTDYTPHEENLVTNSSDKIIALWNLKGYNATVAVYEHDFGKGRVIHFGVFGTDILMNDNEMQFFLLSVLGLLQVNARIIRDGCTESVFAWPSVPPGSKVNATSSYLLYRGVLYQMDKVGPQLFETNIDICPTKGSSFNIFIFASNIMSGFSTLPVSI
jgi:hypothetical protein